MYEQLCRWEEIRSQRQETWRYFNETFEELKIVSPQKFININDSVPLDSRLHQYTKIILKGLFKMQECLLEVFFMPIHLQPKMKDYKLKDLTKSVNLWKTGLALPIHQKVRKCDILKVASEIKSASRNL